MSRVFRRPMFRKGGGVNMNGIMSGIQDRENYSTGTQDVEAAEFGFGQMGQGNRSAKELGYDFNFAVPTFKTGPNQSLEDIREQYTANLLEAAGDRGGYDPLTTFLLQYGPAFGSAKPKGGLIATALDAAKEPLGVMLKEKADEDAFLRGIRTKAAGAAITTKEDQDKMAMEIENKLEIAKADVINKGKELQNKIYANKELTEAERDNLLTQLAANRKLALEKLEIQGDISKAEIKSREDIAADKITSQEKIAKMNIDAMDSDDGLLKAAKESIFAEEIKNYPGNVDVATRATNFKVTTSGELYKKVGSKAGGVLTFDINDENARKQNKQALKQLRGKIVYDPYGDKYHKITKEGFETFGSSVDSIPIDDDGDDTDDNNSGGSEKKTSLSREDAEAYAAEKGLILIGERPENAGRNWMNNEKKRIGENAVSMEDIKNMMRKDEMDSLYGNIRKKKRIK